MKYVQKNQDKLEEDQQKLQELLKQKYHITLAQGASSVLLIRIKKQIKIIENEQAYKQFKKIILSKPRKTRNSTLTPS